MRLLSMIASSTEILMDSILYDRIYVVNTERVKLHRSVIFGSNDWVNDRGLFIPLIILSLRIIRALFDN